MILQEAADAGLEGRSATLCAGIATEITFSRCKNAALLLYCDLVVHVKFVVFVFVCMYVCLFVGYI